MLKLLNTEPLSAHLTPREGYGVKSIMFSGVYPASNPDKFY